MPQTEYDSASHDLSHDQPAGPSLTDMAYRCLVAIASLKITVTLLSLGIILVFFGTMAQIDQDVWPVVDAYFRSFYVWIPFQLIAEFGKVFFELPPNTTWKGSFPFPGGHIIGGLMLINLLAAHAIRFKVNWKRSGVLLIHSGMVMLMIGELITGQLAVESRMTLQIGETANFIDVSRRYELAFTSPIDDKTNEVVVVPDDVLIDHKGKTISDSRLPVDIEVVDYWPNTSFETNIVKDQKKNRSATVWPGDSGLVSLQGIYLNVVPSKQESGVESTKDNAAGFRLRFKKKGSDEVLREHFISQLHYRNFHNRAFFALPKTVDVDGTTYQLTLRNKREEKPYSLHMLKFEHGVHERTTKAKDYASTVELFDPRSDEKRELKIYMNNPLRHDGVTFYQAGFVPDDSGTVLQVVRNPGWLLPYLACITVSLGMLIHFGMHLSTFLKRRAAK